MSQGDCASLKYYPGLRQFLYEGRLGYFPEAEWKDDAVEPSPFIYFYEGEQLQSMWEVQSDHSADDIEDVLISRGVTQISEEEFQQNIQKLLQESNDIMKHRIKAAR